MRSIRARVAIALCALAIILAALASGYAFVAGVHSTQDGTYVEAPSSVRAPVRVDARSGHVVLRVNTVADASTQEMTDTWEQLGQDTSRTLYPLPLVPPSGEKYLIANITVTDTAQRPVSFSYTDMYLVGRDGSTYYANYAAANGAYSGQLVRDHTLSSGATNTLYVLFPAPTTAEAAKLVYASNPPIVVNLA